MHVIHEANMNIYMYINIYIFIYLGGLQIRHPKHTSGDDKLLRIFSLKQ